MYENRNNKLSFSNKNHNKNNKSKSNECYINQNSKKNIILNQILNSVQINLKEKNEKNKNKKKVLILLQIVTEHQKIYPLIIL